MSRSRWGWSRRCYCCAAPAPDNRQSMRDQLGWSRRCCWSSRCCVSRVQGVVSSESRAQASRVDFGAVRTLLCLRMCRHSNLNLFHRACSLRTAVSSESAPWKAVVLGEVRLPERTSGRAPLALLLGTEQAARGAAIVHGSGGAMGFGQGLPCGRAAPAVCSLPCD